MEHTGSQRQIAEKEKSRREKMSSFFYDIAKLEFAGTFIVNMPGLVTLNTTEAGVATFITGIFVTAFFVWIANRLLTY